MKLIVLSTKSLAAGEIEVLVSAVVVRLFESATLWTLILLDIAALIQLVVVDVPFFGLPLALRLLIILLLLLALRNIALLPHLDDLFGALIRYLFCLLGHSLVVLVLILSYDVLQGDRTRYDVAERIQPDLLLHRAGRHEGVLPLGCLQHEGAALACVL